MKDYIKKEQKWLIQQNKSIQSKNQSSILPSKSKKATKKNSKEKTNEVLKKSNLNILYTNADSISNKKDELEFLIKQRNVDIALICETESKNQASYLPSTPPIIEGYYVINNKEGRWVSIIYKDSLEITVLDDINKLYAPAIFVKVSSLNNSVHLAVVYRSPNISTENDLLLNNQMNQAIKSFKKPHDLWRLPIILILTG